MQNSSIIFSGGSAKGMYQLGFVKAFRLWFNGDLPDYVCGTSVGGWNAYVFSDLSMIEIVREHWLSINSKNPIEVRNAFYNSELFDIIFDNCVWDMSNTPNVPDIYVTATSKNAVAATFFRMNDKSIEKQRQILRAAVSIPILSKPSQIDDNYFNDALFQENTPLSILDIRPVDFTFCVFFGEVLIPKHPHTKIIPINLKNNDFPFFEYFNFSKENLDFLFEQGFKDALSVFKDLFPEHKLELDESAYEQYMENVRSKFKVSVDSIFNYLSFSSQKKPTVE